MNKTQLIDEVAAKTELSKKSVTEALDSILESITNALAIGDTISFIGFGTFSVKTRAARVGRNPKTGEPINIEEAKIPSFKAGKALKDAVQESATT